MKASNAQNEDPLEQRIGSIEHKQALRDERCVAEHKSRRRARERLIDAVIFSGCGVTLALSIVGAIVAFGKCLP